MDGIHDLGGVEGFGAVPHIVNSEAYSEVFHRSWENLPYSMAFVGVDVVGAFTHDAIRHAIERLPPRTYMTSSYYDRVVQGIASLFVEAGVLSTNELNALVDEPFAFSASLSAGRNAAPHLVVPFEPGDKVRVRNAHVTGHVRFPGYVRGKVGTIQHRSKELYPFPDANAHKRPAKMQPTYHVLFEASELWNPDPGDNSVVVDLFEGYLEPFVTTPPSTEF